MGVRALNGVEIDQDGVPRLSKARIERAVEEFLGSLDLGLNSDAQFGARSTPLTEICRRMENYGIKFIFDDDLGLNQDGRQILGKVWTTSRVIYVDRSLDRGSPRWRFVLAHEIGHFVLHRGIDSTKLVDLVGNGPNMEIRDSAEMFDGYLAWLGVKDRSPLRWLEWQASSFASALLLPQKPFKQEFEKALDDLDIRRRGRPALYVDEQRCNIDNLHNVLSRVSLAFEVPKVAAKYRLVSLELLEDVRSYQAHHVSQPVASIIESMLSNGD